MFKIYDLFLVHVNCLSDYAIDFILLGMPRFRQVGLGIPILQFAGYPQRSKFPGSIF